MNTATVIDSTGEKKIATLPFTLEVQNVPDELPPSVEKVLQIAKAVSEMNFRHNLSHDLVFKAAIQAAFRSLGDPITF